jgi:phospholipid transport system substrate-binding protein
MRGSLIRSWLVAALAAVGLCLTLATSRAAADDGARAFAQALIDQGFAILRDARTDQGTRVRRFDDFITAHMDARKAALFTLGRYRRGAPDNVVEAFIAAFSDYSTAIYGAHLIDYQAATLRVVGDITNKPGDVTVMTLAEGGGLNEPLRIAFRLSSENAAYKIVDVQVAGIWLSVEQRDQFAAVLAQSNGDIPSLTAALRDRASRLRAGG